MKVSALQRLPLAILAIAVISVLSAKPAHADEWSKTYNLSGKPERWIGSFAEGLESSSDLRLLARGAQV